MPRYKHYSQLVLFDTLAGLCMLAALLTGWLPGPGGIPLFIIGLSLLAINHTWARRYIDLLRKYADQISDIIFIPKLWWAFDSLAAALGLLGVSLLAHHGAWWIVSLGIFTLCLAAVTFLGNRNRWARIKKAIKNR